MRATGAACLSYVKPVVKSTDFSRPFVVTQQNLRSFLMFIALKGQPICRSYVMDTQQQQLALGNIQQPTLEQVKRNEGSICQTHHQVAGAVWAHYAFNSIIGGFIDIQAKENNCFVIRIFGYSNTYTTCDDGYDDKAEFDRAQIARQIIQTATACDINLLSSDTESDHIRILLRIP